MSAFNFEEHLKNETGFLKEMQFKRTEKGGYVYMSKDETHLIKLDFILAEYRDWLIAKGIVKYPNKDKC